MYQLELIRYAPNSNGTIHGSILIINNDNIQTVIPTLENRKYKIAKDTYKMECNYSNRFNTILPYIHHQSRSGIRIHNGYTQEHSKGCILVNNPKNIQKIIKTIQKTNGLIKLKITEL